MKVLELCHALIARTIIKGGDEMPTSVRGMKTIEKSFVSVTAPGSASKKDGHPALPFQI